MLNIVVGAHDFHNTADRGRTKTYAVERIMVHSMIDKALIRVQGSFDLQVHTPICLPDTNFDVRRQRNIVLTGE